MLGFGAHNFLALPMRREMAGIMYAAVLPEPGARQYRTVVMTPGKALPV